MYLHPEPARIRRHFARVDGREVHYRRAGSGPAVVVLHQSPTSSAEMVSVVAALAAHFTVIAPDTPGYGLSDPLPATQPEMADYAAALAALLDALGLVRCGIYGTHTGAMIAAEFARTYPQRVTAAVLDGYVVLTAHERTELLAHYFVDASPRADGGHLAWYWSRIRDQVLFFPWYDRRRAARMRFDVPAAELLQPYVLDLLRADRMGTPAYAAAFRYPADERIAEFTAPTWLLNYTADAISHHPERLATLPVSVRRQCLPDPEALLARAAEIFAEAGAGEASPATPAAGTGTLYVDTGLGQLLVRRYGGVDEGGGADCILLHAPGMSSREWQALPAGFMQGRRLLAPDLPGHGDSAAVLPQRVEELLDALELLLDAAGPHAGVLALEASGWLALALRQRRPQLAVTLVDVPLPHASALRLAPDLTPCDHGGHLLAAWQCARDAELFRPWHSPVLAHALQREFDIEPARVHARAVDLLKAAGSLPRFAELLAQLDVSALLALPGAPPQLVARTGNGAEADAAQLAARAGVQLRYWPAALQDWRASLSD
jgi:pimeloyl-ACP methyl ester carboxylesterase